MRATKVIENKHKIYSNILFIINVEIFYLMRLLIIISLEYVVVVVAIVTL
jgi:hypothetical protein